MSWAAHLAIVGIVAWTLGATVIASRLGVSFEGTVARVEERLIEQRNKQNERLAPQPARVLYLADGRSSPELGYYWYDHFADVEVGDRVDKGILDISASIEGVRERWFWSWPALGFLLVGALVLFVAAALHACAGRLPDPRGDDELLAAASRTAHARLTWGLAAWALAFVAVYVLLVAVDEPGWAFVSTVAVVPFLPWLLRSSLRAAQDTCARAQARLGEVEGARRSSSPPPQGDTRRFTGRIVASDEPAAVDAWGYVLQARRSPVKLTLRHVTSFRVATEAGTLPVDVSHLRLLPTATGDIAPRPLLHLLPDVCGDPRPDLPTRLVGSLLRSGDEVELVGFVRPVVDQAATSSYREAATTTEVWGTRDHPVLCRIVRGATASPGHASDADLTGQIEETLLAPDRTARPSLTLASIWGFFGFLLVAGGVVAWAVGSPKGGFGTFLVGTPPLLGGICFLCLAVLTALRATELRDTLHAYARR